MTEPDNSIDRNVTGPEGHRTYWQITSVVTLLIMTVYVLNVGEKWTIIEYLWAGVLVGISCLFCFLVLEIVAVTIYWILTAIFNLISYLLLLFKHFLLPETSKNDVENAID